MAQVNSFPHIPLKLVKDAPPKTRSLPRKINPTTARNKLQRAKHAKSLNASVEALREEWNETMSIRQREELPSLPEAISIFLRIDPESLPIEDLRKFGIEVIGELEDGYIIGASADITLSSLAAKIQAFSQAGQNNVAALWEIIQGKKWRHERILSPELKKEWPQIRDHDQFVVDIGVACLGTVNLPEHPNKRKLKYKSKEKYEKALEKWHEKRDLAYEEWNDLAFTRYSKLIEFINKYQGNDLSGMIDGTSDMNSLPDSFTCRISISGKGLRDLVLNFQYLFDVSEVEEVEPLVNEQCQNENVTEKLIVEEPSKEAPKVCIIDSGIQERHPLLRTAIDHLTSKSWINEPTDVADYVSGGGHGTRVAGAVLYPIEVPFSGKVKPICWIQNARVLDENNKMPKSLFPPNFLAEIVKNFHQGLSQTKLFNCSVNAFAPCRLTHMSIWAATIDNLTWANDILFIVSAGNIPKYGSVLKPGIREYINGGFNYPDYLLEKACRVANPAQSLQAITVGSVGLDILTGQWTSFTGHSGPSSFSRTGPGIWGVIKPEVVEYGGDFAYDSGNPPNLAVKPGIAPQLVSSTLHGGQAVRRDQVGTSFASPKVAHIIARIQETFPNESTLLYRALLIQSAQWPEWTNTVANKSNIIRQIGYGIPDEERATKNTEYRITLITNGEVLIRGRQVHIYEIKIPEELRRPGDDFDIRVDITLSYKAQPRRTRRHRQRYLSTWLEWQTSKLYELTESFVQRMIELAGTDGNDGDDGTTTDSDVGVIQWVIRERSDWGEVRGLHRRSGTVQKDWAIIKSYEFEKGFCIAIIGHTGWNVDLEASVPYSLAVSFEAINKDIEIYSMIEVENIIEVEEKEVEEKIE